MIFDLIEDFAAAIDAMPKEHPRHRILALLNEAIRRDIHFLDRHSTTLFQCMWNTCWWYDCAEAAAHYENGEPPSDDPTRPLSRLLENWRVEKEAIAPGFTWLRCHPPPLPLGCGQLARLEGHQDHVASVAFSPDGARIASGSSYATVRVWDAASGSCLKVIEGIGDVQAIAAGATKFPWRALAHGWDTITQNAAKGETVASLPAQLGHITTHPSGRTWAGSVANHLYIMTLEGDAQP